MPLIPSSLATSAKVSLKSTMPKTPSLPGLGANSLGKVKPTTPQVTINSPYVRAGLRGESVAPKGMTRSLGFHNSNMPQLKMNKSAGMNSETKHELASTGLIGATGVGTGMLGHKLLEHPRVGRALSKMSPTAKSGLVMGGLGLLGDYAAVKAMKKISPQKGAEHKVNHMNKVASYLSQRAAELRESSPALVAVELLKQAGMSEEDARYEVSQSILEKSAAAELTYSGIDMESAARMVKAANINVRELQSFSLVSEEDALANTLEKAATYIEEQSAYIAELESKAVELEKSAGEIREVIREVEAPAKPAMPEQITKMASVGALTFDDLEALKALPVETLTKMSSAIEQPWEFGKGSGRQVASGDPLLNFLMG